MKTILIIISALGFLVETTAQKINSSYYGKKCFVEVSGAGSFRVLYNLFLYEDYLVKSSSGESLIKDRDIFDGGFNTNLGMAFNSEFGISLSTDVWFSSIAGPAFYGSSDIFDIDHERLRTRMFSFCPAIFFSSKNPILPIGLSHEIGFGITRTRIIEDEYLFNFIGSPNYFVNEDIDFKYKYKGVRFFYGVKGRIPLSKSLAINTGIRFTFNRLNFIESNSTSNSSEIETELKESMNRSFINLNIGLTYLF